MVGRAGVEPGRGVLDRLRPGQEPQHRRGEDAAARPRCGLEVGAGEEPVGAGREGGLRGVEQDHRRVPGEEGVLEGVVEAVAVAVSRPGAQADEETREGKGDAGQSRGEPGHVWGAPRRSPGDRASRRAGGGRRGASDPGGRSRKRRGSYRRLAPSGTSRHGDRSVVGSGRCLRCRVPRPRLEVPTGKTGGNDRPRRRAGNADPKHERGSDEGGIPWRLPAEAGRRQ